MSGIIEVKSEWLDWAVKQGLIEKDIDYRDDSGPWIQWANSQWIAAVYNPEYLEVAEDYSKLIPQDLVLYEFLEFIIRDEIDKRGWVLHQMDIRESSRAKTFRATVELHTGHMIGGQFGASRLVALMLAFREAMEAQQ